MSNGNCRVALALKAFVIIFIGVLLFSEDLKAQCSGCELRAESRSDNLSDKDEFQEPSGDEFSSEEEFAPMDDSSGEFEEFEEFSEESFEEADGEESVSERENDLQNTLLERTLWILFFTIVAGVLVRFKATRNLRSIFLIAFLIYLGFYIGGCPCPISSFQNVVLAAIGVDVPWQSLVWFLGLIPITYFLGKVWCGWICHLGAFQEILYLHGKFNFLKGLKAQRVMKIIRWVLFAALIIQVLITQTNWFIKIDPFKVAFNFISVYPIGWYLLGLLILSSVFIHRPFCKAACPIGLLLGFVSKIPRASVLGNNKKCRVCNLCNEACKMEAIVKKDKNTRILDNKECQLCGDCLDSCAKDGISFFRKSKEHNDKVVFTRDKNCVNSSANSDCDR